MKTRLSIILIGMLLASCKTSPVTSDGTKHYSCNIKHYRRVNDSIPIVLGCIISDDLKYKDNKISGSLFLDGQRIGFYDADRADKYELSIIPGIHRLQVVTITYYTAEANFRIKSGDSLRIDFQLHPDQRTLY